MGCDFDIEGRYACTDGKRDREVFGQADLLVPYLAEDAQPRFYRSTTHT